MMISSASLLVAATALSLRAPARLPRPCASIGRARAPRLQVEPGVAGVPSIEVLAAKQRMALLLHENWGAAAGLVGGLAGDQIKTGASSLHGLGVFAARDLDAGECVTLYPVDRILQTLGDGRGVGTLAEEADEAYFAAADSSPDVRIYRQVAYRQTYSHPDPQRPASFQLDANADKRDVQARADP